MHLIRNKDDSRRSPLTYMSLVERGQGNEGNEGKSPSTNTFGEKHAVLHILCTFKPISL